jgi:cobalt-zinc-cadmium efflux system membrane fusion protein
LELTKHKLYALGFNENEIDAIERAPSSQLSFVEIKSPVKGKIINLDISKGELVSKDQEIFEIGNIDNVWAEVNVFPQDRQHMKKGQSVIINSDHNFSTNGNVLFLSPVIDSTTRTSKAIVLVDNSDGRWVPGSFTNAEIVTNESPANLIVSKEAVQNIEGNDCVFVVADGGFEVRQITKGQEDLDNVEVLSGLDSGEKVACKNTFLLRAELQKDEAEHMD